MEKNPSNFFICNSDNDFDLVFRSNLIEKAEESTASVKNFTTEEPLVKK
jgi:hypothetical protein